MRTPHEGSPLGRLACRSNRRSGAALFRIAREAHYKRFFGPIDGVAHSMSVDLLPLHIDVYRFAPTAGHPCWTLITGGMSDLRQPAFAKPPAGLLAARWRPLLLPVLVR